jgi:hypothetical protein
MTIIGIYRLLGVIVIGTAVFFPVPGNADTGFSAALDGPTAGNTSPATGTATFILNEAETEVAYVIEYSGLLSTETVAHIHNAPPGVIGPVFHDLVFGSPKVGVWPVGPFEVAELRAGRVNILIHTELYPGAEIRGNLILNPVADVENPGGENIPTVLDLKDNYPNPFNPMTTITFGVPREERVLLDIYDVRGLFIGRLLNESLPAGYHSVVWDGRDVEGAPVASGVYLYRLEAGSYNETKRMVLMK